MVKIDDRLQTHTSALPLLSKPDRMETFMRHIIRNPNISKWRYIFSFGRKNNEFVPLKTTVVEANNKSYYLDRIDSLEDRLIQLSLEIEREEHRALQPQHQRILGRKSYPFLRILFSTTRSPNASMHLLLISYRYGNQSFIDERHQHRYEVNPDMVPQLEEAGLSFTGKDESGQRMQIIELQSHPYYVGVQFHPEFKSRPGKPSALFLGLIAAASGQLDALLKKSGVVNSI